MRTSEKLRTEVLKFSLSHANNVGSDFYYRVSANFTYARNKVIYMDETPWSTYDAAGNLVTDRSYMNQTGRPLGSGLVLSCNWHVQNSGRFG
jgi:hypothetical protein